MKECDTKIILKSKQIQDRNICTCLSHFTTTDPHVNNSYHVKPNTHLERVSSVEHPLLKSSDMSLVIDHLERVSSVEHPLLQSSDMSLAIDHLERVSSVEHHYNRAFTCH